MNYFFVLGAQDKEMAKPGHTATPKGASPVGT
jgi:hypothetical protein